MRVRGKAERGGRGREGVGGGDKVHLLVIPRLPHEVHINVVAPDPTFQE